MRNLEIHHMEVKFSEYMNGCQLLFNQSWAADTEAVYGGYSSRVRHGFLQVFIMRIDIGVSSAHPCFSCLAMPMLLFFMYLLYAPVTICHASVFSRVHYASVFYADTALQKQVLQGRFFWGLFVIHVARDTFFE